MASESQIIKKETIIRTWSPYKVVPLWSDGLRDDIVIIKEELPQLDPSPATSGNFSRQIADWVSSLDDPKEHRKFLQKIFRDGSFGALVLLACLEIILDRRTETSVDYWRHDLDKRTRDESATIDLEDNSLLVEAWPIVQECICWKSFVRLYWLVHDHLHMITLPHPLTEFAKRNFLLCPSDDYEMAVNVFVKHLWLAKATQNRLEASQYLLDFTASLPPIVVGVLLEDPFQTKSHSLPQSCLPSACLELSINSKGGETICNLLSLYDLPSNEGLTISTRQAISNCSCTSCIYQRDKGAFLSSLTRSSLPVAKRLAHSLFQQEAFEEAKALYERCHGLVKESSQKEDMTDAADLWHAIGAVELTRHRFVRAQEHWKQGSHYSIFNTGIDLQLEKQKAYQYFESLPPSSVARAQDVEYITRISRRLYVTPNLVSRQDCRKVIAWADQAASETGWTTSRHYAVPTTDVPVHVVPPLLDWFQNWMNDTVEPLLKRQFQVTNQRFYVHDAFVARYTAESTSRFLPLHYDESTHSFVLALNEPSDTNKEGDFEGGGTYIWQAREVICPPAGSLVSFRGNQLLHGGMVVTKGVRYILAVFLYLDEDTTADKTASKKRKMGSLASSDESTGGFSFGFF